MATMIKEKRREKKKKPKEKPASVPIETEEPIPTCSSDVLDDKSISLKVEEIKVINDSIGDNENTEELPCIESNEETDTITFEETLDKNTETNNDLEQTEYNQTLTVTAVTNKSNILEYDLNYTDLNLKLDRINISFETTSSLNLTNLEFESSLEETTSPEKDYEHIQTTEENACPSAPLLDEVQSYQQMTSVQESEATIAKENEPKLHCMSLEEATRLFGGTEVAEVQAMSDREEAIVEAGPMCGPDHPLVDLLSNLRCSLNALERERTSLATGFRDEERYRSKLWKIETRNVYVSERCVCDATVGQQITYKYAELMKSQLPVAKMKLESLLRDVELSYCHHQHAALLAHCQIDELVAAITQSSKSGIREALSLILKELRVTDSGTATLSAALQRWARALAAALLEGQDLRQTLFLWHNMTRQSRSVRWLARLVRVTAGDAVQAARAVALLRLVMTTSAPLRTDRCSEATEDAEEAWEELDKSGLGGAVSDGAMRERDLLSLFHAFPTADIVARLALFRHRDISTATSYEWGDGSGGRGVLKSSLGTRVLTATCALAVSTHPRYERLAAALVEFARQAVSALADLHLHTREHYTHDLALKISAEVEEAFRSAFELFSWAGAPLHRLPFRMLEDRTAMMFFVGVAIGLHETSTKPIDGVKVTLPRDVTCASRVRIIVCACADRAQDHDLARNVLEFLFQLGLKREPTPCKGGCAQAARDSLSELLSVHPYLYCNAFLMFADACLADSTLAPSIGVLSPSQWRPSVSEIQTVVSHYATVACPALSHLLMQLDTTPHSGLSLDTQLHIGVWLAQYVRQTASPEWTWRVLRRLKLHRVWWGESLHCRDGDPSPLARPVLERDNADLFVLAHNLLATSWGHCVPLICTYGVDALLGLAKAGRLRDVTHCLSAIMLVMTQSPESVSLTPKFCKVFSTLLESGPSMFQRALGRGGESGCNLLLKLMLRHLTQTCTIVKMEPSGVFSVWLHSLWRGGGSGAALLEVAVLSSRMYAQLDHFVALCLQDETGKEIAECIVRNVSVSPHVTCSVLRGAQEVAGGVWPRLLAALHHQHGGTHVDNALKSIGAKMSSDDLVIHKTATAVLAAPLTNPAHLDLWRLLFCLYLQRPPTDPRECTQPVGPLLFSGFIKTRVLNQLKKRLTETANHHFAECSKLKSELLATNQEPARVPEHIVIDQPNEDPDLLPQLKLIDLTGEADESSDSSDSESEVVNVKEKDIALEREGLLKDRITFHVSAESIIRTYLSWLEEGDKVRAMPHHIRAISDQAVSAACKAELERLMPPLTPDDEDLAPTFRSEPIVPAPDTPFERVLKRLTKYQRRPQRKRRRTIIKSPIEEMITNNSKTLISMVENHLRDLDKLTQEWSGEVSHLSQLDSGLWSLVGSLWQQRPIPAVKKSCSNKCRSVTLHAAHAQHVLSEGAQRGVLDNRASARAALRRLARPRPQAARTAAALHTITRQVRTADDATRILELAWRCTANEKVEGCVPVRLVLTNIVNELAQHIVSDGDRVSYLVSRWCRGELSPSRVAVAAALLSPRQLAATGWQRVYLELLRADIPPHTAFSFLSKFEVSRWSQSASLEQRRSVLDALAAAVTRHGSAPHHSYHVLMELVGVHSATLQDARTVGASVTAAARAAAGGCLPPAHWGHLQRALDTHVDNITFEQLRNTLHQLGMIWWEAREEGNSSHSSNASRSAHSVHAPHVARILQTLIIAFLHSARNLHYDNTQVAWFSWEALQKAWSAWVEPSPPQYRALLPPEDEAANFMLQQHCRHITWIMHECRGSEAFILQEVFEWMSRLLQSGGGVGSLLAEVSKLPWRTHQWVSSRCMPTLLQLCRCRSEESTRWASEVVSGMQAGGWLHGVSDEHITPHLMALFYVFTSLTLPDESLEEATKLPWWRLPALALEHALEQFFKDYYSLTTPYHSLPCFRIVLYASELAVHATNSVSCRRGASEKRECAVSLWVRATSEPTLQGHVADATRRLLDVVTTIAPTVQSAEGEVVALLTRALTVLCTEPAGHSALPVWKSWVESTTGPLVEACVCACASLTVFEHYAELSDVAVRAHLLINESGWARVEKAWRGGHWSACAVLASRGRLYAGYATCLAVDHCDRDLNTALLALQACSHDFVQSEAIVATWICLAGRVARRSVGEARAAAGALLRVWGEAPRRSLLKTITMTTDDTVPTPKLRLLCRLAQCVVTPNSEAAVKDYEASCVQVLGSNPGDVVTWGRTPHPRKLPRLAVILLPKYKRYFQVEYDLTPEDN